MLYFTIASGRNDWLHLLLSQLVAAPVTLVAFSYHPMFELMLHWQLLEHGRKQRGSMTGSHGDHNRAPGPFVETPHVHLGRQTSPRTSQRLGLLAAVF